MPAQYRMKCTLFVIAVVKRNEYSLIDLCRLMVTVILTQ